MSCGGRVIPEEMCETLDDLAYDSKYTIADSAFYGEPQMRERVLRPFALFVQESFWRLIGVG